MFYTNSNGFCLINYRKCDEQEIYGLGGRTFLVLNLAPIGCYPAFLAGLPHESSDIDEFGCMSSYNNAVVDYNNMLKDALAQTRKDLSDANVVYVDTHALLLELCQHPTSHGTHPKYIEKDFCLCSNDVCFCRITIWKQSMLWNRRWFLQL